MPSVRLDRENRGKVNAVRRVPVSSSDKGNICMHERTGHLYTRRQESGSLQDFFNICSDITYVSNEIELLSLLVDDTPRIITLGDKNYNLTNALLSSPIVISAPKVIMGKSPETTVLKFKWDPGRSLYDLYFGSNDIHFCNLTISRTEDSTPQYFVYASESGRSGFHNCRIGYNSTNPTNYLINLYESDYFTIEDCFLDVETNSKDAMLIYGYNSDHLTIKNSYAEQQVVERGIKLINCDRFHIDGCFFSNNNSIDSNAGIVLSASDHGVIERTKINMYAFEGISDVTVLSTVSSPQNTTFSKDVKIHDCDFQMGQDSDYSPENSPLVCLAGKYISMTDTYVAAQKMDYNASDLSVKTTKPVVIVYGSDNSLEGNTIIAEECRCAVMVDANEATLTGSNSFGTKITNNYISDFGVASAGTDPSGTFRTDANGILLTDIAELDGSLPCAYGVISNNTIVGDSSLCSTAITGCPISAHDSAHALYWSVMGNIIWCDPPSGATVFGIEATHFEECTIIGNLGPNSGKSVVNGTGTNNEYGTTNSTEGTGANL